MSSVQSGTDGVVIPFVGDTFVNASGTVGVLETSTVNITGLDTILSVTVSNADAKKILSGFQIDEADTTAGDANADVTVSMKDATAFEEGLVSAIQKDEAFSSYLYSESRAEVVNQLVNGGLADILEANDLLSYTITLDASAAASDMNSKMTNDDGTLLRVIFTQIEKSKIDGYIADAGTSNTASQFNFLPLNIGDVITFVWDTTVGEAGMSSGPKITAVANSTPAAPTSSQTGVNPTNSGDYYSPSQVTITSPTTRRVALKVTLGDTDIGSRFTVSATGNAISLA